MAGYQSGQQQQSSVQLETKIEERLVIHRSLPLHGEAFLHGAKNAVLPIMTSLILTSGKSILSNIPNSSDVRCMISLLEELGASVHFDVNVNRLHIDTSSINSCRVNPEIMKRMRASVLAMGPLLARLKRAEIALPGGCDIGKRPIDYHIAHVKHMGATCEVRGNLLTLNADKLHGGKFVLDYPSVGTTENIMMAATLTPGRTIIINAALEPEVLDLIAVLQKMGARISIQAPATIIIEGVNTLHPIVHEVLCDRLEAGGLLLAAAITGGDIYLPQAREDHLESFLAKLRDMGHSVMVNPGGVGIRLIATDKPQAVFCLTGPFPGFPTDLQAPMMAALCVAQGTSIIRETVYENRLIHVKELQKLGADIRVEGDRAYITGVKKLIGAPVKATDIRASCSLVLAGLIAEGVTSMTALHHWRRGYQSLEKKLSVLGATLELKAT